MARVTIEDCIEVYPNRFEMVLLAARRARQLLDGQEPVIEDVEDGEKPPVLALREIGGGKMTWEQLQAIEEMEKKRLQELEDAQL